MAVGELRLYRAWYLNDGVGSLGGKIDLLSLRSSYVQYLWKPGVNEATHVHASGDQLHHHAAATAPVQMCGCGIYGVFDPSNVQGHYIIGVVEYWGKVLMGNLGIRAQFARIVELAPGLHSNYHYTRWTERDKRARLRHIGEYYDARVHFSQRDLIAANAATLTTPGEFGIRERYTLDHDFG